MSWLVAEARHVPRVDPYAAAPPRTAAHGGQPPAVDIHVAVVVRHPFPRVGRADDIHHFVAEHLGHGLLEGAQQRQPQTVDAHIVVLVERTGPLQLARFALALPEGLLAHEVVLLAEERAFPLGFLLQVHLPGDERVARRIVAAVLHRATHRLVESGDLAVAHRDARHGREHTLGHRVGRIHPRAVAELGDDVSLVDHESVGPRALGGHRAQEGAENALLVAEVDLARGLARLRVRDGRVEGGLIHPQVGRRAPLPGTGRRVVDRSGGLLRGHDRHDGGGTAREGDERRAGQYQRPDERQAAKSHVQSPRRGGPRGGITLHPPNPIPPGCRGRPMTPGGFAQQGGHARCSGTRVSRRAPAGPRS
jgi:hypothetical protein